MDKRKIKKTLKMLNMLKNWQLLLLLFLVIFVIMTAWRMNNVGMVQRRDAVLSADKELDSKKVRERLVELQNYVNSHMNSSTGTIALVKIYEKDSQAEIERVSKLRQGENIHKKVAEICDPQFTASSRYSRPYFECWDRELSKYPSDQSVNSEPKYPPQQLYEYNFDSPLWTPDLAGWATLVAIFISVVIIFKVIFSIILRAILKKNETFI